ncbi:transposase [Streptomyces mirabilis]
MWHKRRWWRREASCPRKSFTEQIPQIPAGTRLTERLRCAAGRWARDAGSTVVQAAHDLGLSWPVVMDAFLAAAARVIEAPLPEVRVLGIDETRRGRTRWEQDPDTGKWQLTRDRWHTGFVDALGTGGLLGQVEGRTVADVLAWLSTTPLAWRKTIRHAAIDMSATYRAAVRAGLPDAIVVVDHFHVDQLANKMLSMVRRRTTAETRGRRGRAADPEWKARRRLLRNREDLTDEQFAKMWNPLLDEGKIGPAYPPCPGPHRSRPRTSRPRPMEVPDLVRRLRHPRSPHRRHHRRPLLTRNRRVPRHRSQQCQERGHQPRDQARGPQHVQVPQRRQSASTDTLRHDTTSPRTPPHRLTSKTCVVPLKVVSARS